MDFIKIALLYTVVLTAALTAVSCADKSVSKNSVSATDSTVFGIPEESGLYLLADTSIKGHAYTVYGGTKLSNKYHTIYLKVKDKNGRPVDDKALDLYPEMNMGQMKHGGPYEHPIPLGEGWYKSNVVFIMADIPDMGTGWHLHIIRGEETARDTVAIKIPVSPASLMRTTSSGTRDDSRVFLSCLLPDTVKQGKMPIQFLMNKMDHQHFPALDGYEVRFKTDMPGMRHDSPDNKGAVSAGNGYYEGLINFSMAGDWEINVELWKDGKKANQDEIKYHVHVTP
ncbi:FixH family protein [Sphingobacterium thalpophilum]|uniref:FixH family protein n=1 Tax=Sphingobacterium thalpophilum TaxID=259 RepID=A0ABV4HA86_9SPHI